MYLITLFPCNFTLVLDLRIMFVNVMFVCVLMFYSFYVIIETCKRTSRNMFYQKCFLCLPLSAYFAIFMLSLFDRWLYIFDYLRFGYILYIFENIFLDPKTWDWWVNLNIWKLSICKDWLIWWVYKTLFKHAMYVCMYDMKKKVIAWSFKRQILNTLETQ